MTSKKDAIMQTRTMAVTKALLGNRQMKDGVVIVAGDILDADGRIHLGGMANDSQTDIVHLGFDAYGDEDRRLTCITLVMPRDPICYIQTECRLPERPAGPIVRFAAIATTSTIAERTCPGRSATERPSTLWGGSIVC